VLAGLFFVVVLFGSIISQGYTAFGQTMIQLEVDLDQEIIDPQNRRTRDAVMSGNVFRWDDLVNNALYETLGIDPDDEIRAARASQLMSAGSRVFLRDTVADDPSLIGTTQTIWFLASGDVDSFQKGQIDASVPERQRQIKDVQIEMIDQLEEAGRLDRKFNWGLFTNGASSRPEQAGLRGALVGSFYMVLIVLALALPIGVASSIYLEEFAPKNRFTDLIEVNISNLAAVPSIVFGILGLALFINFFGLPRSAPLVGGLVLTLMTLPTIIITTRAACAPCRPRSARRRWAWARRRCSRSSTMCCRWPRRASSPARSSAWRRRWARLRRSC
jgi:phosphate transport system permease protein